MNSDAAEARERLSRLSLDGIELELAAGELAVGGESSRGGGEGAAAASAAAQQRAPRVIHLHELQERPRTGGFLPSRFDDATSTQNGSELASISDFDVSKREPVLGKRKARRHQRSTLSEAMGILVAKHG